MRTFKQVIQMLRKSSGFTMHELMVVLAIVAIISAIATPNLIDWLPQYRLSSGARSVLSAIELTRLT
ncbi:MAG: prepilin-type N-terminal cleavage/methylation domain-containing protein, partial [Desulfobacterales bacterium]